MKFLFVLLLLPVFSFSQEKVYDFVEEDPSFPGGMTAMTEFIVNHVEYPEEARANGEQGIVFVKFVVAKNGEISHVGIRKGATEALNAEAIRVVQAMPKWIPGKQNGEAVAVNFTLPIHFRLGNNDAQDAPPKPLTKKEKKKLRKQLKKAEKKAAKQKKKS